MKGIIDAGLFTFNFTLLTLFMFIDLFYKLRKSGIPVSITEYLTLMDALDKGVSGIDIDGFYYLMRATLVKDEKYFDRFDRIFGAHFEGMEDLLEDLITEIPLEWLRKHAELNLSEEEKKTDRGTRRLGETDGNPAPAA